MSTLYLAGPIDLVGKDGQTWKQHLLKYLQNHVPVTGQLTSFDPAAPYGLFGSYAHTRARSKFIENVNTAALGSADIFIALLPTDKASVGTPIELDMAARLCKCIFVLSDVPYTKSIYTRNRVSESNYIQKCTEETLEKWMDRAATVIANSINAPTKMSIMKREV
jgi:nucleoside 2-deoxyribosyltransferase